MFLTVFLQRFFCVYLSQWICLVEQQILAFGYIEVLIFRAFRTAVWKQTSFCKVESFHLDLTYSSEIRQAFVDLFKSLSFYVCPCKPEVPPVDQVRISLTVLSPLSVFCLRNLAVKVVWTLHYTSPNDQWSENNRLAQTPKSWFNRQLFLVKLVALRPSPQ